jgi:fumarate reductase flavoprotein subunit
MKKISRKEFLRSVGVGAAGLAAVGLLSGCNSAESVSASTASSEAASSAPASSADSSQDQATSATVAAVDEDTAAFEELKAPYDKISNVETLDVDFCVIGAGPAGLCAAVQAAQNGLSTVVIEKNKFTGGCARFGMGILAIGSKLQEAQGENLDLDTLYNLFTEYTHYRTDPVLVRRYFEDSVDTMEWIEQMGVEFQEAARYFDRSYPTWHIVKSDNGTVGGGQAETMTRKMEETATSLGVTFLMETTACEVIKEGNKVTGVHAYKGDESAAYDINAKAVLICTGGFGNNSDWVKSKFGFTQGEDFKGMQFAGHDGDGLKMAWAIGCKKSVMIEELISDTQAGATQDISQMMRQPNLMVNEQGKRFFNEDQVQNTTYTGNVLCHQTNNVGFMIFDEAIKNQYVAADAVDFNSKVHVVDTYANFDSNMEEAMKAGKATLYKADTLEDLANYMGIDAAGLAATVEEYNTLCANGYDPLGKPAQYLKPIQQAPYYCSKYLPSSYGTLGGITINSDLEVLDTDNKIIQGLYSAGTDSCTIYGDSYMFLLPGNTMGYCVNTGRMAGNRVTEYVASL